MTWTADNLLRHTVTLACATTSQRWMCGGKPRGRRAVVIAGTGIESAPARTRRPELISHIRPTWMGGNRRAPTYIWTQRDPRRPSRRRSAHTGERPRGFPLPRSRPLRPSRRLKSLEPATLGLCPAPASLDRVTILPCTMCRARSRARRAITAHLRAKALEGRSWPPQNEFGGAAG
jgi:hypothetical protein